MGKLCACYPTSQAFELMSLCLEDYGSPSGWLNWLSLYPIRSSLRCLFRNLFFDETRVTSETSFLWVGL